MPFRNEPSPAGCRVAMRRRSLSWASMKAFTRGHRYFTLVNDLERSRVLYVVENRTEASLDGFWAGLTGAQIEAVEAVAMDMWDPYINSTCAICPTHNGRSCSTSSTSPNIFRKPLIWCGAASTSSYALPEMTGSPVPATTGCGIRRRGSRAIDVSSPRCGERAENGTRLGAEGIDDGIVRLLL